jgi:hypothetical protein
MSCVFRASGQSFEVDAFLRESALSAHPVFRRGSPRLPGSGSLASTSGFNVAVSDAEFDNLREQIDDALAFVRRHEAEIRRLRSFPGVETVCLDFGVPWRDVVAQTDTFPPELLRVMGDLGIELTVSHYQASRDVAGGLGA